MSYKRISLLLLGLIVAVAIFSAVYQSRQKPKIQAFVTEHLSLTDTLYFSDSTKGAKTWRWEFAKGVSFNTRSGGYRFTEPGTYPVRLTINKKFSKVFKVEVINSHSFTTRDSLVYILAPKSGIEGEKLVFNAYGVGSNSFKWYFGESGTVDSREPTAIHSYSKAGRYEIMLYTNVTRFPVKHKLTIYPNYRRPDEPEDVMGKISNDFKERLQKIAKGENFNLNYNYLLQKYLCKNNYSTVQVNGSKVNDFYSYCMGLQFGEGMIIDSVGVARDKKDCISKIHVMQREIRK